MDLKDCEGRLVQKGWRVLTTHKRLAESLELPCRCQKGTSHGRSEQVEGSGMDYPDAYARRVSRVLLQELTFQDTIQECQGKSLLCEGFGEGEFCTCGEVNVPGKTRTCPNCLQGRRAVPGTEGQGLGVFKDDVMREMEGSQDTRLDILCEDGAMDDAGMLGSMRPEDQGNDGAMGDEGLMRTEAQGMYTESQIEAVEHQASKLIKQKAFHHKACASLIRDLPLQEHARTRQALKPNRPRYLILGVYAYGNHYGITRWTRKLPQTCNYLWLYLQHWSPDPVKGSTLVVNDNCAVNIHRDHNNLPTSKNHIIGVTPFQQGELWLEGEPPNHHYKSCVKTLPNGQACSGHLRSVRQRVLTFDARQWHTTQPWQGDRVILGGYTSRGVRKVDDSELQWLQQAGFPCEQGEQQQQNDQSYVAQISQAKRGTKMEEEIKRKLYLLHAATGHGSTRHMIDALRRRNVNPLVLRLAEEFVCPICAERKRVQPRQLASLEPLPPKFHTVVADIGHWRCPSSGEQQNFMLAIDEGSRFRVAKILSKGSKQTPNSATCLNYLTEGWIQVFGKPKTLRLDPAGSFRSAAVENFCDRHSIYMDVIPGEAHWQIGIAEQAIQGVKQLMNKLHDHDPELTPEQNLSLAVATFNQREMIRGFSPVQHVLGQSPDVTDRHIENLEQQVEEPILNNTAAEFKKEAARRAAAEKALCDWQAQQRVNRAMNSRSRELCVYRPGDLVYFWRTQESGQHKRHPGTSQGRFLGPARVLAMESRSTEDGQERPGHAVWLVRGRSLLKCAPEQLRPASHREELVDSLAQDSATPWTFSRLTAEIGGNQFEDISTEIPPESEWRRAQDVTQEVPPSRTRLRGKRPVPLSAPTEDLDLEEVSEPSQPSRIRRTQSAQGPSSTGDSRCFLVAARSRSSLGS